MKGRVSDMAKRNRIVKETCALSLNDLFPRFVASQTAKGVSEKTIKTYQGHFHCIGLHLDNANGLTIIGLPLLEYSFL